MSPLNQFLFFTYFEFCICIDYPLHWYLRLFNNFILQIGLACSKLRAYTNLNLACRIEQLQ